MNEFCSYKVGDTVCVIGSIRYPERPIYRKIVNLDILLCGDRPFPVYWLEGSDHFIHEHEIASRDHLRQWAKFVSED